MDGGPYPVWLADGATGTLSSKSQGCVFRFVWKVAKRWTQGLAIVSTPISRAEVASPVLSTEGIWEQNTIFISLFFLSISISFLSFLDLGI